MIRTIPSNNIILFSLIFFSTTIWAIDVSENIMGLLFYALVLLVFLGLFAYFREPNMAFLKVEEGVLKVRYLFRRRRNRDFSLYKIENHVMLDRYVDGELVGTFPSASDYLNHRWYFTPDKFLLRLQYEGKSEEIEFNTNVIGFNYFMVAFVKKLHSINTDKLKTVTTNFNTSEVAFSWLSVLGRYFIE